jgi:hypothetical protein
MFEFSIHHTTILFINIDKIHIANSLILKYISSTVTSLVTYLTNFLSWVLPSSISQIAMCRPCLTSANLTCCTNTDHNQIEAITSKCSNKASICTGTLEYIQWHSRQRVRPDSFGASTEHPTTAEPDSFGAPTEISHGGHQVLDRTRDGFEANLMPVLSSIVSGPRVTGCGAGERGDEVGEASADERRSEVGAAAHRGTRSGAVALNG